MLWCHNPGRHYKSHMLASQLKPHDKDALGQERKEFILPFPDRPQNLKDQGHIF